MNNTAEKRFVTIIHLTRIMQILRDAIQIEFDKQELIPPVPTFLLNEASDRNFTPTERHILRLYADKKFR